VTDGDRARALALLRRHGWNATSFQILEPGFRYWFDSGGGENEACVAYIDTGSAWVAAGAPIAEPERAPDAALRFVAAAAVHRRRACFFGTEDRFTTAVPFAAMRIGEQPAWDPGAWDEILRGAGSLRAQIRRARAKISHMITSMTGFARREAAGPWGTLVCELRSVNHRFLESGFRLPDEVRAAEPELRQCLMRELKRGKVDCTISLRSAQGAHALCASFSWRVLRSG